jgi:hypothetical protein
MGHVFSAIDVAVTTSNIILLTLSIAELVNLEVELAGQQNLNWRTMFPSTALCSITCIG